MNEEQKKQILSKMESIIGHNCYNGNTQNWGPYGEWLGEGRFIRYPITFLDDSKQKCKRFQFDAGMNMKKIRTGYYNFGANNLMIIQALEKIIDMLETEYKLK